MRQVIQSRCHGCSSDHGCNCSCISSLRRAWMRTSCETCGSHPCILEAGRRSARIGSALAGYAHIIDFHCEFRLWHRIDGFQICRHFGWTRFGAHLALRPYCIVAQLAPFILQCHYHACLPKVLMLLVYGPFWTAMALAVHQRTEAKSSINFER